MPNESRRGSAAGHIKRKYKAKTKCSEIMIDPFGLCFITSIIFPTALLITNGEAGFIFNGATVLIAYKQGFLPYLISYALFKSIACNPASYFSQNMAHIPAWTKTHTMRAHRWFIMRKVHNKILLRWVEMQDILDRFYEVVRRKRKRKHYTQRNLLSWIGHQPRCRIFSRFCSLCLFQNSFRFSGRQKWTGSPKVYFPVPADWWNIHR